MGQQTSRQDFDWVYTEEPHATRRKLILADHPEIKELMGPEPRTKWIVLAMVSFQLASAYAISLLNPSWWMLLVMAYLVGGVVNHSLTLAIHEISHNLAFGHHRPMANRALGILANLPIGIPYSISFKKYHLEHHRYQGDEGRDMDMPSELEGRLFHNTASKLLWLFLQPLFYAIRPVIMYPMPISQLEMINTTVQFVFDLLLLWLLGPKALIYLVAGTYLALGIHPVAGHFIAEHYVMMKGYETYSYYGILNYITFNVGYHNEHHDFPFVAWSRLSKVKEIAPEWYNHLPSHNSWTKVLYDFVTDPDVSPYARIKRHSPLTAGDASNGQSNGVSNGVGNGHSNGVSNGHSNGKTSVASDNVAYDSPMLKPDYSLARKRPVGNANSNKAD